MLLFLTAIQLCSALHVKFSPSHGLAMPSRRALVHGAAAAATLGAIAPALATEGDLAQQKLQLGSQSSSLGSAGISAYEQLKLDKALTELAEPFELAGSNIKPTIELLLTSTLPKVRDSKLDLIDTNKISVATESLLGLATDDASLETQAASMVKLGSKLITAVQRKDEGAAALAATALAEELTDFAYEYGGKERPLPPLRAGQPVVYTPGARKELPVSGKTL